MIKIKEDKEKFKSDNEGSILILLVLIITLIISLGVSLISITMVHYKIKKSNSEIKQTFYLSEKGLDIAYIYAYGLVNEAIEDSISKAENYLIINPLNVVEANIIFKDNFKLYIINNILNRLTSSSNPILEINNYNSLLTMDGELILELQSKYTSENNIEKITGANLIIKIPEYGEAVSVYFETDELMNYEKWEIVK